AGRLAVLQRNEVFSRNLEGVMSLRGNGNVRRKSILLFAWIAISAFVWGQHKPAPAPAPKAPAEHASKPVRPSNPSVERAPIHAPSPNLARKPNAPLPARNPRGNGASASAAGRPENTRGNRGPDPVVDHIGDISEYRRGTAHLAPASGEVSHAPVSVRSGVLTSARSSSQV